ncbi:MgtC/SapB family protein [Flavobacterium aciduliphilum]|uniref:Putative Mg2+ transporter-C (MgtC) family protein n=1 Tax=Flavobacterium aciduliphilum TaxID=1101402 RepID=A0A328YDA7_9FLAO|nr:MgtC/SapB family protein [Flavobacterium aciduliphilum]RAR70092.1 putative Mg2+ transporter-C (MgtC) family protein [Flavobacterium aciduliphilum]
MYDHIFQLLLALFIGSVIGLEREINGKVAGFRTMALICLGSTILTIISIQMGGASSHDRIAANILTGIGFIGAGVVFKDGLNVTGITTAATIWVTAALGMCIGCGNSLLAFQGMIFTIIVLFFFDSVLFLITKQREHRSYAIYFKKESDANMILGKVKELKLKCLKKIETKDDNRIRLHITLFGNKSMIESFNDYLLENDNIKSFDSFQ